LRIQLATEPANQGFIQWGDGGIYPWHEIDMGDIPPQLEFFGILFSGFENLITNFKSGI
jgi:hypothetical protein